MILLRKISEIFLERKISSFNNLSKGKDKWSFIEEARNNRRTKILISCWKNSLAENITDQKRIAGPLKYRFSKIGKYFDLIKPYIDQSSTEVSLKKKFSAFGPYALLNSGSIVKTLISINLWVLPKSQR